MVADLEEALERGMALAWHARRRPDGLALATPHGDRTFAGAAPCPVHVKRAMIDWLGPILYEYYAATEGGNNFGIDSETWLEKPGSVGTTPTPENTRILDEDGFLFLTGRSAETIISGGVNIYPQEVDAVLLQHPAVLDACTVGVPDEEWGEAVKAVVQLAPDCAWSPPLAGRAASDRSETNEGRRHERRAVQAQSQRRRQLRDPAGGEGGGHRLADPEPPGGAECHEPHHDAGAAALLRRAVHGS